MSYLDILSANRTGGPEHAATAKARSRFRKAKKASLTSNKKRAKLRVKRVTKQPGKETRGTTKTPEKAKMAKKSKRSKKRRSAAQRAATAKMLRANKAKRSGKRRKSSGRKARKARKSSGKRKSAKRVAAGKKAARTRKRHKAEKSATPRRKRRKSRKSSGKRRARKSSKRRSSKRRATKSVKVVRLPRKASRVVVVSAPAKVTRRRRRKSSGKRRSSKRRSRKIAHAGFGYKARKYNRRGKAAMENPMDGTELFIGAVTGLAGFLAADVLDRFLATHALTGTAPGPFTDTPPTTGDYAGLFNATAICAPMNATRWLAGLGLATAPLVLAHFISAPKGRAALQFFGYAAGIRIVGKGLVDAVAMLVQPTMIGQQLYDGEMRASALKTGAGTMPAGTSLPSAGLGRARLGAGKPCAPCGSKQVTGAGYPSAPREIAATSTVAPTPATQNQPTAAPVAPPVATATPATPPAPPAGPNQLFGPRRSNALPRRDPNWGYKGDE